MEVIAFLDAFLEDVFLEVSKSCRSSCIDKWKFRKFRNKVEVTMRENINRNDGSILTTDSFEKFLKNYHPIEKLLLNISGNGDNLTKNQFIQKQRDLFFDSCNTAGENPLDRATFDDFFSDIYDLIDDYYKKSLSKNEKYIAGLFKRMENANSVNAEIQSSKMIEAVKSGTDDIRKMLSELREIDDPNLEWSIYLYFSKAILSGRSIEVYSLYPLIKGNSKDLEIGVGYLFKNFSNIIVKDVDFNFVQDNIRNEQIYSDLAEKTIYLALLKNDMKLIEPINERNQDIYEIKSHLQAGNNDMFYIIHTEKREGIIYDNYELTNNYSKFKWITNKICMFSILKHNIINVVDTIESLIEKDCVIEQILLIERKVQKLNPVNELHLKRTNDLLKEIETLINKVENLPKEIQEKFYSAYIRTGILSSPSKANEIIKKVPLDIQDNGKIAMLCMQVKMDNESVDPQSIMDLCLKNEQYWLFYDYLLQIASKSPEDAINLIRKYLFTIDKDSGIFLIYANLVHKFEGLEKSIGLFNEYENQYGKYLDFWINKLYLQYSDEELTNTVNDWIERKLSCLLYRTELDFLKLLLEHNRYDDVNHCIELIDKRGDLTNDYLRIKAEVLFNLKHEIESLEVYKTLFKNNVRDERIIYYILVISFNNKRKVDSDVIEYAKVTENTSILDVLASYEEMNENIDSAYELILKALLRTNDENSHVFGHYLNLHTKKEFSEDRKIKFVAENTATYCVNKEGKNKTICIHSKKILPNESFFWEGAEHIYKDTAIQMGLLRKKIGDYVSLKDGDYKINNIVSLETFLFRISMGYLINRGDAESISIPVDKKGKYDIKLFTDQIKRILNNNTAQQKWIDHYKNMNEIPLPISLYTESTRVTYTQLIDVVVEEKSIPYRELYGKVKKSEKYILTAAALVILHKIGFQPEEIKKEIIISNSLKKTVSNDKDMIINNHDREHVASMGVFDDRLYIDEATDKFKQDVMKKAVELEAYTSKYNSKENVIDIDWKENQIDIKECIGISDYDATCIAQRESYTLVTAEIACNAFANLKDVNVNTICIADFLNDVCLDMDELLKYIEVLMEYRFVIPFTDAIVIRVATLYKNSQLSEQKELLKKWHHILSVPLQDKTYKKILAGIFCEIIQQVQGYIEENNYILSMLCNFCARYLDISSIRIKNENGKLVAEIIKDTEEE